MMPVSGDRERNTWVDSADAAHIDCATGPVLTAEDVSARGDSGRAEATPAGRKRHDLARVVEGLVPGDRGAAGRHPRRGLLRRSTRGCKEHDTGDRHNAPHA